LDSWCAEGLYRDLRGRSSGKLKGAVEHWCKGGKTVEDKSGDDAAVFGLKPQRSRAALVEQHYEVWEENWESLMMFLRMQTQWNVTMGGYVGLKYEVLLGAGGLMSLYDVDNPRELLEDIQTMEAAALAELNKKDGK
jgi:hypothetical protein